MRAGERKIGEAIRLYNGENFGKLYSEGIRYVLLGIPESIGPRANKGKGGSEQAWESFLASFLAVQDNGFFPLDKTCLLGEVRVAALQEKSLAYDTGSPADINTLRKLVERVDERVEEALTPIFAAGLIPIVIGGGHNNVYPLCKAFAQGLKKELQIINCDPHADFRALEGRHSGNGFRYAMEEKLLSYYHPFGLHQNYNSASLLAAMQAHTGVSPHWLDECTDFEKELADKAKTLGQRKLPIGIELDMDAIEYMPSSAISPVGITTAQARHYVKQMAKGKAAWLHLPEAAPSTEWEQKMVGKTLSYLVTDFIKHHAQTHP
ncbi:formimidoylglutamase [Cytophagales bacterium LB-30]|uniref:Formimidoylglutamase n=1 Tax=Shiella aurantiaca TaxID=3058365 RepID=A0ABT8F4N9_9BACT|nr:formimidoylglutamase [Shiella aurantiaca]MDN4165365.1 formimidoylglutamase [Shiella aurantiaca]